MIAVFARDGSARKSLLAHNILEKGPKRGGRLE